MGAEAPQAAEDADVHDEPAAAREDVLPRQHLGRELERVRLVVPPRVVRGQEEDVQVDVRLGGERSEEREPERRRDLGEEGDLHAFLTNSRVSAVGADGRAGRAGTA